MHNTRQDKDYKARELIAQRKSKQNARQDRNYKAKELKAQRKHMHKTRQDKDYKARELIAQQKFKQNARQDRNYKARELIAQRKSKQNVRQDIDYKAKGLISQRKSKQNARKKSYVLECERVKKQECRRIKRKIDEMNECTDLDKAYKKPKQMIKLDAQSYEKKFNVLTTSKNVSNNFIKVYLLGHCLYVHAAIKHGFEKVFAC